MIAAVAKVSCKHELLLVARVNSKRADTLSDVRPWTYISHLYFVNLSVDFAYYSMKIFRCQVKFSTPGSTPYKPAFLPGILW